MHAPAAFAVASCALAAVVRARSLRLRDDVRLRRAMALALEQGARDDAYVDAAAAAAVALLCLPEKGKSVADARRLTVLVVGSSLGVLAREIARRADCEVLMLRLDNENVAPAEQLAPLCEANVVVDLGTGSPREQPLGSVDAAVFWYALGPRGAGARNLAALLRPGGRVLLEDTACASAETLLSTGLFEEARLQPVGAAHRRALAAAGMPDAPTAWRALATAAGSGLPHKAAQARRRVDSGVVLRAVAVVVRGRDVLLVRRRRRQRADSEKSWSLPGGGIDPGENAAQAATREAREEAGAVVGGEQLVCLGDMDSVSGKPGGGVKRSTAFLLRAERLLDEGEWPEALLRERQWVPMEDCAAGGWLKKAADEKLVRAALASGGAVATT